MELCELKCRKGGFSLSGGVEWSIASGCRLALLMELGWTGGTQIVLDWAAALGGVCGRGGERMMSGRVGGEFCFAKKGPTPAESDHTYPEGEVSKEVSIPKRALLNPAESG